MYVGGGRWLPPGVQWDMNSRNFRDGVLEAINSLGSEGWEMTGSLPSGPGSGYLYFKRPKP